MATYGLSLVCCYHFIQFKEIIAKHVFVCVRIRRIIFFNGLYTYLHVGCTMRNKERHLDSCFYIPNLKLVGGCNVFLEKMESSDNERILMVDMWETT